MTKGKGIIYLMFIFIFMAAACGLSSSKASEPPKTKTGNNLTFFIATDIHYLSKSLTDNGLAFNQFMNSGDGKQLNYIDDITNAFVNEVKKKKPDFVIISGDLTTNGEKKSHLDLAKKFRIIEKAGVPVYVIPGNHDILNPYARGFKGDSQYITDYISDKDFSKIYEDFGYNEAVSRDPDTLSYLAEPSKKLWLLMLDTNEYVDNVTLGFPVPNGVISQETLDWIKKCSQMASENHAELVTVMHQNILKHAEGLTQGFTIDNSEDAIKVFQDLKLDLVLSGHIHIQDIKTDTAGENTIYEIVTSALSVYPQHYGIIKYSPENGFDYSTASVDVEGFSKDAHLSDKNLVNFKKYSRAFFQNHAYDMSYNRIKQLEGYTEAQKKQMADTMAVLNVEQFSGTLVNNINGIMNSQGFELLKKARPSSLKHYGLDNPDFKNIESNKIHIPEY